MAKHTPQSTGRLTAEKRKQELIDELVKDCDCRKSFWGESGIFADLKKRIAQRAISYFWPGRIRTGDITVCNFFYHSAARRQQQKNRQFHQQ